MTLVTVLLPVRNEERFIEKCLGAILAQDYPELEVLVIDGDSEDRTVELAQSFHDPRVRILHNPGRKQVKALNLGLEAAQGEIIVRVDGHTIIAPNYVRQAVKHLQEDQVDNVGGLQRAVGTTPTGRAIAAAYSSRFAVPSAFKVATQDALVDTVFLGAWRRNLFERVGKWDENCLVNEDYEHNIRIRQAGGKILLTMDMQSTYYCRDSWQALWRQYYFYGYDRLRTVRRHPDSLRWRQVVAPAFVMALIGGGLLGVLVRPVRLLWLLMIGVYGMLAVAESYRQSRGEAELFWRMPLVFVVIHLAWGLGFWRGIGEWLLE